MSLLPDPERPPLRRAVQPVLYFLLLLWGMKIMEVMMGTSAGALGVRPRSVEGLVGLVTGPLLHGDFEHLFANTLPLLILGTMLVYAYPRSRWWVVAFIWIGSGLGVWLTGRDSVHLGASGLSHGLMFFLFVAGIIRRDKLSIAFAMAAFFFYGGMIWTIFPTEPGVSFESHFWGAVAGVVAAGIFRRWDPPPPRRKYSWEQEEESGRAEDKDPLIGDLWRGDHEVEPVEEKPVEPTDEHWRH